MKVLLFKQVITLSFLSLVGVCILNLYIPPMPDNKFIGWLIEFVLIFFGAITTILMGEVFPNFTPFGLVVLAGVFTTLLWVYSYKIKSKILGHISVFLWATIGTWSTFWGIVYGI